MAGLMPGTAALKIVADDETGELESATILGQFGEVPDDFAESLQGGEGSITSTKIIEQKQPRARFSLVSTRRYWRSVRNIYVD
ncbi:hypothetical protein FV232_04770 [Methylobacterium sp. WL30]|uniref:hypothetical protein n=1 Tax=unclassified Methylobacterium TaxID=2615210 RepID=UPI0011CB17BA|nr:MULTISPECIES: hypothetical protein [unclassified Methylobacterium]TXN41565.1 hypothetical protein FV225_02180 [Methylobacterium sp. WL93]TXN52426.1 hypothetical protein FV227_03000 [Methylobacterium sp. WL119]TXN69769.1 hypothetical protein FV232_04770 [Methylobacterium sp. WL30]